MSPPPPEPQPTGSATGSATGYATGSAKTAHSAKAILPTLTFRSITALPGRYWHSGY
jgi:hypothetical protein